jgi:hypothetical protein
LSSLALHRQSQLDVSHVDVRQAAHAELTWLNEREDREAGRDWADRNLNLTEVEQYYEVNTSVIVCLSVVWVQISDKYVPVLNTHLKCHEQKF